MVLVHDPAQEKTFLTDGYGVNRVLIAYNFYIYVGPSADPAGVTGLGPLEALQKIAEGGAEGERHLGLKGRRLAATEYGVFSAIATRWS
jgi:ABC-type tungstate transport system permease subunit